MRHEEAQFNEAQSFSSVLSVAQLADFKPLPSLLPEAPDLPAGMLPEALRDWLQDAAERAQIPLAFLAAPAVTALAGTIGRSVGVFPKKKDSWFRVPTLWCAVVGRPGVLKSPAIDEAMRPIRALAHEAREEHANGEAARKAERAALEAKVSAVKEELKKAAKNHDDAEITSKTVDLADLEQKLEKSEQSERRYVVMDPTTEKLGELLNENPRGLLLLRDELGAFLRNLNKSGREGDREFYLEAWNGNQSFSVDRIGRGSIHIDAVCLSICGGITPGKLDGYLRSALKGDAGDDGLLQRFQLMVYPEVSRDWKNVDRLPNDEAREMAYEVFRRVDRVNPDTVESHGGIPALRFDDGAQELFDDWRAELERRLRSTEFKTAPAFESHLSKYRSLMPSLALIFHIANMAGSVSGRIPLATAQMAAAWCEFLEQHARKVYAAELNPDLAAAHILSDKIRGGQIEDGSHVREIYRPQWAGLRDSETVWNGLRVLEECGHAKVMEEGTQGRPQEIIRIDPRAKRAA